MWRRLLPLLLVPSFLQASALKENKHYDYSKGLDTYHSSLSLPDGFVQNSLNVLFDLQAPVTKRQGYTVAFSTKGYSFQQAWTYVDPTNTQWIIVRASDSIVANNLSGSTTVLVATVSANNLVGEVNAFGDAFFVDQTQNVYFWNGTSTTYVAGSPGGSLITQWHGRVWVSGLAIPNANQLWGSRQYDAISATAWGTGVNPNDPVTLTIGLQDNFDSVSAIYPFLDTLYIFRRFSIYALYGFDQTSFQNSFITSECGCVDQNSIQTYNHALIFVSERGVESFNGYTCTRISDAVKNMVDASIQAQGGVNTNSWLQSSQGDWNSGTFIPSSHLNSSIASPALILSTFSLTENSNTQWANGTVNNAVVGTSSITLAVNNSGNITNPDFESSFTGNWTASNSGPTCLMTQQNSLATFACTITPEHGSSFAGCAMTNSGMSTGGFVNLIYNGVAIAQSPIVVPSSKCTWAQGTFTDAADIGKRVQIQIGQNPLGGSVNTYLTTTDSYIWSGSLTFWFTSSISGNGLSGIAFDNIQNGSSTITTGSFTSQAYNTGYSSSAFSLSNAQWSASVPPLISLQTSPSNSGPWTTILNSSGTNAFGNQYVQFVTTITLTGSDSVLPSFTLDSIQATASTGTLKSQIHGLGSINSWGNFAVSDALNGGNIVFSICSSTNSNMSAPTHCASQTPNATITIATATFVQTYATFTVTAATQAPQLNSQTVQWFSGNRSAPMASTIWDNRYWLSLTTNTVDAADDAVIVLNIAGAWGLFDIHAGGLVQYKNQLYHSDSLSSGNVYLDNQAYRDNGNAINAYIQTKDYCGEDLNTEDYYESLYTSMDNLGNFNMTIQYAMDRLNSSPYTLSSVNQTEFSGNTAIKIPFIQNVNNQNFGKCIYFTFKESDIDSPWQWYGFTSYSHPRTVQ